METIKFTSITSKVIPLPHNNIDTDQIIPARYLKVTDKAGVVEGLFYDWRYQPDGSPKPEFVLNQPEYQGAQILLAGDNFGCGSSREHAPWALTGWGIRVVFSTSFADIFRNNALKNALLPITVSEQVHKTLLELTEESPDDEVKVDLVEQQVSLPGGNSFGFEIDSFAKKCLLAGMDQLSYILAHEPEITVYEQRAGINS